MIRRSAPTPERSSGHPTSSHLPGGIPASYTIGGRQSIAFTVADGAGVGGMFSLRNAPLPAAGPLQIRVYALRRD